MAVWVQVALEEFLEDTVLVSTYNSNMYLFRGMDYNMAPTMLMPLVEPADAPGGGDDAGGRKRRRPEADAQQSYLDYYRCGQQYRFQGWMQAA